MKLDADSALPLYHQIAALLRARIAGGELEVGDSLPPLRRAATDFGVHLHTVRHAYLALSREGLIEMRGARGTRVCAIPESSVTGADPYESQAEFVRHFAREARSRFGLTPEALAERVLATGHRDATPRQRPRVAVVECSAWQCRSHAAELEELWDLETMIHPIESGCEAPTGDVIVATWFHYNDVRRLWPGLLSTVSFVTIRPDVAVLDQFSANTWWIVEHDEATAGAVASDLTAVLGDGSKALELFVTEDPDRAVDEIEGEEPILFAPRVWASLDDATRQHPRAFEMRYVFDGRELQALAARHDWPLQAVGSTLPSG